MELNVENGKRAKRVWELLDQLPSTEERQELYTEWREKKVITDDVAIQIRELPSLMRK